MPTPKFPTDSDHNRFELRSGTGRFPAWSGVNKDGDTASTPGNQLRDAINIRPETDGYRSRGGQTKAATNNATSDLDGMYDATDIASPEAGFVVGVGTVLAGLAGCTAFGSQRLYMIGGGNATNEAVPYYYDGATLDILGTPADGQTDNMLAISGATCLVVGTNPYGFAPSFSEVRTLSPSTGGTTALFTIGTISTRVVNTAYVSLSEDGGIDGLLLGVAWTAGSGTNPGVYVTRNLSTTALERATDDAPGNESHISVHLTKRASTGLVYVGMYDATASGNYGLFERASGGASYTRIVMDSAAGQINAAPFNGIGAKGVHATANVNDAHVYIFGRGSSQDAIIGIYPGETEPTKVQLGRNLGSVDAAKGVHSAEDFNGFVYFGYGRTGLGARLAKVAWNGGVPNTPTWTDVEYDFTAGAGSGDSIDACVAIKAFSGSLYAWCLDTAAPNRSYLYKSSGTDTTSFTRIGELVNAGVGAYALNQSANMHMAVI